MGNLIQNNNKKKKEKIQRWWRGRKQKVKQRCQFQP
jgi:hypothetical protein